MLTETEAEDIHQELFDGFEYRTDEAQYKKIEYWIPDETLGDCEDYAMALIRKWILAGAHTHDCGLAYVKIRDTKEGHAVAWIEINEELYWADCNSGYLHDMDKRNFDWISYMRMDNPTKWLRFGE